MLAQQQVMLAFTRGINPIPVPNQVTSKTAYVPFTDAGNDWQGRYYPVKLADGNWCAVWLEGTFHSDYNSATHKTNIHFSNDEGATWTDNNEYIGGGAITGWPLVPPDASTGFVDFCMFTCPNGDVILIAQNRGSNPGVWNNVNFSQYQYRSTDNGATWTYEADFCVLIGESTTNAKAAIQGLFETMTIGNDVYVILCQIRTDLNDTRIRIYKTSDNATTWTFVSNPIEYDEADPDCTESALAHLGNGRIICVFRTQDLGQALWKVSNDYGATWGAVTEFSEQLEYVGLHQPRITVYSNFALVMGRDNKKILGDPSAALFERNSWWTTTDLFASPCPRYYLDPFYTGDGTANNGDAGYTRAIQKLDNSFMFFGYYGLNSASLIYKYDVSHTAAPSTENYSNIEFFPETLTTNGVRLQFNRDNILASASAPSVGIAKVAAAHNTLGSSDKTWLPNDSGIEIVIQDDRGWAAFTNTRLLSGTDLANLMFKASFSIGFWLDPDDGQPAAAGHIFWQNSDITTTLNDGVVIQLATTGKLLARYAENSVLYTGLTDAAVFANGAVSARHIAITFTSGDFIRIYVDGSLVTLDATSNGNMAAANMANFSSTRQCFIGQRRTGASTFDLPYIGKIREFIIQPVVWSVSDVANIMLN